MLIVMRTDATAEEVDSVCRAVREAKLTPHPIPGKSRTAIGVTGNLAPVDPGAFAGLPGVIEVIRVTRPFKLTNREMKPEDTIVHVRAGHCSNKPVAGGGPVDIGGPEIVVIAGPCSVESHEQTIGVAAELKRLGAHILRGGAFKPRTSPYAFQGLGAEGLKILAEASTQTGLPIVSELMATDDTQLIEQHVDIIQIGARNMQNYALLKRAGRSKHPVFLKRGMSSTLEEFLLAAEYVMSEGNRNVILCERGIRAFSDYSRFTLDLSIVPELKRITHLPVIVDPSHAAGKRDLVIPLARAAIAAGADGVMVEVHTNPKKALSDAAQALTLDMFAAMMDDLRLLAPALHRRLGS
ncbi:MAG: 3-deoxy-7-phosphoheptulonate synthase [Planctomycetes bacterium]|nr:3-deoxy-7-phosphoheptulonate synthase [Planctomycetota bacterium]